MKELGEAVDDIIRRYGFGEIENNPDIAEFASHFHPLFEGYPFLFSDMDSIRIQRAVYALHGIEITKRKMLRKKLLLFDEIVADSVEFSGRGESVKFFYVPSTGDVRLFSPDQKVQRRYYEVFQSHYSFSSSLNSVYVDMKRNTVYQFPSDPGKRLKMAGDRMMRG